MRLPGGTTAQLPALELEVGSAVGHLRSSSQHNQGVLVSPCHKHQGGNSFSVGFENFFQTPCHHSTGFHSSCFRNAEVEDS